MVLHDAELVLHNFVGMLAFNWIHVYRVNGIKEDLMMGYQDVQDAMMAEALSALSGTRLVCSSVRVVIRVSYLAFRNWPYGP